MFKKQDHKQPKDLNMSLFIIYFDYMRFSTKKDDLILDAMNLLIDSRISRNLQEPYRTMVLRAFKKFRSQSEIDKFLNKARYYKNTV